MLKTTDKRRRSVSNRSKSPQLNPPRGSFKNLKLVEKIGLHTSASHKETLTPTPSKQMTIKARRTDTEVAGSEKILRPKLKRNSSALSKVERDRSRIINDLGSAQQLMHMSNANCSDTPPGKQRALINAYLTKHHKSPSVLLKPSKSTKNVSFTTINNISMQHMINRNINSYQTILNKTHVPGDAVSYVNRPNSPLGGSGIGAALFVSNAHNRSPSNARDGGDSAGVSSVPNFQKKLKKYISKRATVLKKNNNNG